MHQYTIQSGPEKNSIVEPVIIKSRLYCLFHQWEEGTWRSTGFISCLSSDTSECPVLDTSKTAGVKY